MFGNTRDDVERTAREKAQSATDSASERVVDAVEKTEEYQRRRRSTITKAFGAGVAVGAVVATVLRR